ncbi:hypothetical protein [Actinomadura sp. NPDC000600]|uniref:hypothetical protein n=1 Tax=Actinomadura sp. NPDC000600 TaxID=3154262 RepID=UPI00339A00CB
MGRTSDLVCLSLDGWLPGAVTALGMRTFLIPVAILAVEIGMAWHPCHSSDRGHQWFRDPVRAAVRPSTPTSSAETSPPAG